MYDENGKPVDVVPEDVAIRRGMVYSKDRHGKVCRAEVEAPLLIDQLYNHEIIHADHHFYGVQVINMRKLFLSPLRTKVCVLLVTRGEDDTADKSTPMDDMDYLKVLRHIRNHKSERIIREVCDEAADPYLFPVYGRDRHAVAAAFDSLCAAVRRLWDDKDVKNQS